MKRKYANESEIPEALKQYYKQEGTEWVLQVEGMVATEKVTEFRDTSTRLKTENEQLTEQLSKFKDVDVDKYRRLLSIEKDLSEDKLFNKNKIDELVTGRTEEMRRNHESQLDAVKTRAEKAEADSKKLKEDLSRQLIDRTIIDIGVRPQFGLEATGHIDLVNRAHAVASLDENNKLVFKNPNGTIAYGKDGITPLTPEEWVERQATIEAKHLFKPSTGTGAGGQGQGGGGGGGGSNGDIPGRQVVINNRTYGLGKDDYNPWDKKAKDLDGQGLVYNKDKALADAMCRQATGKALPAHLLG